MPTGPMAGRHFRKRSDASGIDADSLRAPAVSLWFPLAHGEALSLLWDYSRRVLPSEGRYCIGPDPASAQSSGIGCASDAIPWGSGADRLEEGSLGMSSPKSSSPLLGRIAGTLPGAWGLENLLLG